MELVTPPQTFDADSQRQDKLLPAVEGRASASEGTSEWTVPADGRVNFAARSVSRMTATKGLVWVTIAGDLNDYFLHPGESMAFGAGALVFAGPLNHEDVRFVVELHADAQPRPQPGRPWRWFRSSGHRGVRRLTRLKRH
jgi:hypothetical protein